MRKALNENPVAQVVMLGVLGIVVAFLFMTRVVSQDEGGAAAEPAAPATESSAAPSASTVPTEVPSVPADPAVPAEAIEAAAPVAVGFEAGAGLPERVVRAYEQGDAVAVLVVNRRGTEDRKLETEARSLDSRGDTSVFVVEAKNVARYSRIAQGVDLDRVPAFVVVEPRRQVEGELPEATVAYGFRGQDSLAQVIRDALYNGRELPFHPG